MLHFND